MFSEEEYELIDFGDGRRLERFAEYVVDRPAPAASSRSRVDLPAWKTATARFQRKHTDSAGSNVQGQWQPKNALPDAWNVGHGDFTMQLRPTDFGHLGVFPEQAANWDWIARQVSRICRLPEFQPMEDPDDGQHPDQLRPKILNLFAHTGGSTLAAACRGAEVVHVDSAKNVVSWARHNASLSKLDDAPIRWIVEDVRKFVAREVRRGNQYDAVILDPPSYGHGPKGEAWKLSQHLVELLEGCRELTRHRRLFVLLTCHTPGYGPAEVEATLADGLFGACSAGVRAQPLSIPTTDGRRLPAGVVARWSAG